MPLFQLGGLRKSYHNTTWISLGVEFKSFSSSSLDYQNADSH